MPRGFDGSAFRKTFFVAEVLCERRFMACMTTSPAMMAFVVAIAGMMLPAISEGRSAMLAVSMVRHTFDLEAGLLCYTVSNGANIGSSENEVKRIVVVFVEG